MSEWRFLRGWTESELRSFLAGLREREVNFDTRPEEMTVERGWTVDGDDQPIWFEPSGPPLEDGPFQRARRALIDYDFSDPTIVKAYFDRRAPLDGRDMLLEFKVLGFRFLNGVRVRRVRETSDEHRSSFSYRYDTLAGHIEQGYEWFLLSKNHQTGMIRFRIEAHWQMGDFPTWWSRLGFRLLGKRYRERWRRRAVRRLRLLVQQTAANLQARPSGGSSQVENQEFVGSEQA